MSRLGWLFGSWMGLKGVKFRLGSWKLILRRNFALFSFGWYQYPILVFEANFDAFLFVWWSFDALCLDSEIAFKALEVGERGVKAWELGLGDWAGDQQQSRRKAGVRLVLYLLWFWLVHRCFILWFVFSPPPLFLLGGIFFIFVFLQRGISSMLPPMFSTLGFFIFGYLWIFLGSHRLIS